MSVPWKTLGYAALGSGGALGSLNLAGRCGGTCSACFGCLFAGGALAGLALGRHLWNVCKEKPDGMAQGSG